MPKAIVCSQCGYRPDTTDLRCQRCGGAKFQEVDAESLKPKMPSLAVRKAGHEATYNYMLKNHGKAIADRWYRAKRHDY